MIAQNKRNNEFLRDNYAVIDVNGVGYKVFVTTHTFGKIAGKPSADFYTHTYVREDTLALYGFLELEELEMFELLISISGIGPKRLQWEFWRSLIPRRSGLPVLNDDASIPNKGFRGGEKDCRACYFGT